LIVIRLPPLTKPNNSQDNIDQTEVLKKSESQPYDINPIIEPDDNKEQCTFITSEPIDSENKEPKGSAQAKEVENIVANVEGTDK
jgi:hypothetical protein